MNQSLLMAIGLVFVIEGLLYALVQGQLKTMMKVMENISNEALRTGGMVAVGVGVFIVWIIRTFTVG